MSPLSGIHPVREALRAGRPLDRILIAKGSAGPRIQEIVDLARERGPHTGVDADERHDLPLAERDPSLAQAREVLAPVFPETLQELAVREASRPGRKIILWVSPGWPLLSGPNIELTTKQQENLFAHIVSLSTILREGRITLYSVDPLGTADAASSRTARSAWSIATCA